MRGFRHGAAVLLALVVGSTTVAFGQVAQGGSPWKWGADLDLSAIPSVTTAALDLEALAAEDAVTDQYKEAPWRFRRDLRVIPFMTSSKSPDRKAGAFSYPERDLNPHGPFGPTEFKSVVSTNSTIRAGGVQGAKQRRKAGRARVSVKDGRDPA